MLWQHKKLPLGADARDHDFYTITTTRPVTIPFTKQRLEA
jgi:hypothetical protein